jgi:signal transduction histidine kinase
VRIAVRDTGPGVPGDIRSRIFDPFFTTKPVGEGSGVGLSVCHGMVSAHGGSISVDDAGGGGAVFTVLLPAGAGDG